MSAAHGAIASITEWMEISIKIDGEEFTGTYRIHDDRVFVNGSGHLLEGQADGFPDRYAAKRLLLTIVRRHVLRTPGWSY